MSDKPAPSKCKRCREGFHRGAQGECDNCGMRKGRKVKAVRRFIRRQARVERS